MAKQNFEKGRGFFITGTDTGVGKTLVTGAIARRLVTQGKKVGVFKPIASGCVIRREGLVSEDAEFLAHCSSSEFSLTEINPVRYHEPLAPAVAVERSKRKIDWEEIHVSYNNLINKCDYLLVEGVGGIMVPLEDKYLVLDLMEDMALPVLVVARSGLGTINHTLLTINACRSRDLQVVGVIMNGYQADKATLAEETNPRVIAELGQVNILTVIPYDKESSVEKGRLGDDAYAATGLVNWVELLSKKAK